MSMSDLSKQQVLQEFCQQGLIPLENGKTGFFCFTRSGRISTHIEIISPIWSQGSVAHF